MQGHARVAESKRYRALRVARRQRGSREDAVEAFVGSAAMNEDIVRSLNQKAQGFTKGRNNTETC